MHSQIEEQIIELFPKNKPLKKFDISDLKTILKNKGVSKVYYCSSNLNDKFISNIEDKSLLQGYYNAYVNHCPITITPDILWMLIVQGFSRHVEKNSEELRNKFVNFQGKKEIKLDSTNRFEIEDITKEEWEKSFEEYVKKIRDNVGGLIISLLTPCFSTSTKITQNAVQIAIISTFKSYFKIVRLYGGCGFPYICLKGTLMDYMQLKLKIQGLYGYLIDDWVDELGKIVDKILETKQGKIDKDFWMNFIKNKEDKGTGVSGNEILVKKISGWLLNFYPFYKGKKRTKNQGLQVDEINYTRRKINEDVDMDELKDIPDEIIDAPMTMVNIRNGKQTELYCKTGFIGVTQDENFMITPEIGCFVCEK